MTEAKRLPDLTRVRELLDYNPETGEFRWKDVVQRGRKKRGGLIAGTKTAFGYWHINLDGEKYMAHRLAWLWVHQKEPPVHIDHINGDGSDNRISNLREADTSQNIWNSRRRRSLATNMPRGVIPQLKGGGYAARIMARGVFYHIGTFRTPEEASAAYRAKAKELHGEYAHA